jgi:hypothetical protein
MAVQPEHINEHIAPNVELKVGTETPLQRRSPPSAAERMRAVRKRRRLGSYLVRVPLDEPDIDGLVRLNLLHRLKRNDPKALQVAVMALIYRVLEA